MEEALLIWDELSKDEDGFPVKKPKQLEVYVKEKSVRRSEKYEAMRSGISVDLVLELRIEDWERTAHVVNGKKQYAGKVQYDGCQYDIIRSWKNGKAMIELSCG